MPGEAAMLEQIDAIAGQQPLAQLPVIESWKSGSLSRDDLRFYATQYFHHVDAFPRFVSMVHSRTADGPIRKSLVRLLASLEDGQISVSDQWLKFCATIGLFSDSVRAATMSNETHSCVDDFMHICEDGTVPGLAALYAYVRQIPALTTAQLAGLAEYGIASGPGRDYFEVRQLTSAEQSSRLRELLILAANDEDRACHDAIAATRAAHAALVRMVEGSTPAALRLPR